MKRFSIFRLVKVTLMIVLLEGMGYTSFSRISAQTIGKPVYYSTQLTGTKWIETSSNQYKRWTVSFSDSIATDSVEYITLGEKKEYARMYYLSEEEPAIFDFKKVGKVTSGQYLVLYINKKPSAHLIVDINEDSLKYKHGHGYTLAFKRLK